MASSDSSPKTGVSSAFAFPFGKDNLPKQLFINNEYVDSTGSKKLVVYNPKDCSLVADDIALAGEQDVDAAVAAAEKAFPAWRKETPRKRRDLMLRLADLITEHAETLAALARLTLGAPYGTFGYFETDMCAEALRYYAGWIDKFAGETYPQDDGFLKIVRHEPLGVTAGICPWNSPLATVGLKAGPALAAGNCFILKPSEKTPLAGLALGSLARAAGFPAGVFQVLSGDGSTGALLASHMRVRKISFTGSTSTGRRVQEAAARSNLKRVTLELGGKSPAVVFDDCNLENAVTWCTNGITANSGQVCFAASRVYVQAGIYERFVAAYRQAMADKTAHVGDPEAPETQLGPLVDRAQFERVSGFLERGRQQGGRLLLGGGRVGDSGFYVQPTIFEGVPADAEIVRDEIFGPVAVVNKFATEEEVLRLANATSFGLMAGVFTQDINRAMRVAAEFESGMVGVNCISIAFLSAPFGGSKESGIGRENALEALRQYTEPKTVMVNLTY